MKCINCGAENNGRYCEFCGSELPSEQPDSNNYYNSGNNIPPRNNFNYGYTASSKDKITALVLCVIGFFGFAGLHRFYTGKIVSAIVYLFTGGIFGIGTIIDLILIVCGSFTDKHGNRLS